MLTKNFMRGFAALAAATLLVSCAGDGNEPNTEPSTPGANPTTAAAATSTTEPETAPAEAESGNDTSAATADASGTKFAAVIGEAMKSVTTMKSTAESDVLARTVTEIDLTDRDNVVMYSVSETASGELEVILDGAHLYTRSGGSDWAKSDVDAETKEQMDAALWTTDPERVAQVYASATLLDADERKYEVELVDETVGSTMIVWLDSDNRIAKQEIAMDSATITSSNEYNVPLNIPAVPGR